MKSRFGPFTIDPDTRQLLRDGSEIHLSPKAFDVLCTLLQRRPNVIEKTELQARIWPDTYVVEANLNVLVGEIRRAIGDKPHEPEFIRTVHGVGYAFCGAAVEVQEAPAAPRELLYWVVWKGKTFPLSEGDNIIGRDPGCSVWLDAPGVSRRHARIRIDSSNRRVTLDDLGSTNGTLVRRRKIQGDVELNNGDPITIGTVDLTIRLWSPDKAPETKRIRRKPK